MSSHLSALAWTPIHSARQRTGKQTREELGEQKNEGVVYMQIFAVFTLSALSCFPALQMSLKAQQRASLLIAA